MTTERERGLVRALAGRVAEIANLPEMEVRRRAWRAHNSLEAGRPMVLCFPEGAWEEILPQGGLECADPGLRWYERRFRSTLFWWENLRDDGAMDPYFNVSWQAGIGDYGVPVPKHRATARGSYVWDAPIRDLDCDLSRLKFRQLSVDREGTMREVQKAGELFGDLLPPRIRGGLWWTMGLTWSAIDLVGLERFMELMVEEPEGVRRLMAFLRDDMLNLVEWAAREGILSFNNEGDYVGSGGLGYTAELPAPGGAPGGPVRPADMWGFAESQETTAVSPAMFGELVFPYQLPLLGKFGLNCYGCCEPVSGRWEYVRRVPRLRRVSVAPSCDQAAMAGLLGTSAVFSRKPNPVQVCVGFDEKAIRDDVRATLEAARGCVLEIIMKDTHTVQGDRERLGKWVRIAKEEVDRFPR